MTGPAQRVRAFDGRHPLWWDVTLAAAVTLISANATPRLGPLGTVLLVVVGGAVLLRRRRPFAALAAAVTAVVVTAVVSTFTGLDMAWAYLGVWVLLFEVGLRDDGRVTSVGALGGLTALAAFVAPADGAALELAERFRSSSTVAAMCAAAFLVGVQISSRRRALEGQRQEAARAAVVAERSRIAQEMHDIIGHNLSVITSLANGGAVAVRRAPRDAERAFDAIGEVSRSSVREVRHVLAVLRHDQSTEGAALSPQPGLDDVGALVESVRAAGVQVQLERAGDLRNLSPGRQLAAYRIVQESLTNVLRHVGAPASVHLMVAHEEDRLVVQVDDTGTGTPTRAHPRTAGTGHGILGMRERAQAYGGTVRAGPLGTGWRVRADLPVEHGQP